MASETAGTPPAGAAGGDETWAHYLDADETLLWQGAPSGEVRYARKDLGVSLIGCLFLAVAIFWAVAAVIATAGTPMVFLAPLFALPFMAVGVFLIGGRFYYYAWVRRHTRYALTERRAIIATSARGRSLKSYPINADTEIDYQPGPEVTIWFAEERRRGSYRTRRDRSIHNRTYQYTVKYGFEYISDGDEVYRLMRQIQQRDAERRNA